MIAYRANLATLAALVAAVGAIAAFLYVAWAQDVGLALALPLGLGAAAATWYRPVYGACMAVIAVPLEQYASIGLGAAGLSPTELLLLLTAAAFVAKAALGQPLRPIHPVHLAFAALIAIVLTGLLFADDTLIIVKTAVMWSTFLVVSIGLARAVPRDILAYLLAVAVAGGILGLSAVTGASDQELLQGGATASGRARAQFTQPNLLGFFLVLCIPATLVHASRGSTVWRLAMGAVAASALAGLVLTLSRSSILGAIAALIVLLAWRSFRRVVAGILFVVLLFGALNFESIESSPQVSLVGKRLGSLADPQTRGKDPRFEIWQTGFQIGADHPVLGIGQGNFPEVSPHYGLREASGHEFEHAHNLFLTVFAEMGIIGLAVLLAFIALLVREISRVLRRSQHPLWPMALALCATLAGITLVSLGDYPLGNNSNTSTLLIEIGALIGLGRAMSGGSGDPRSSPGDGDPGSAPLAE